MRSKARQFRGAKGCIPLSSKHIRAGHEVIAAASAAIRVYESFGIYSSAEGASSHPINNGRAAASA